MKAGKTPEAWDKNPAKNRQKDKDARWTNKLLFLIDQEAAGLVGGSHFAFRPYDYGPFDSEVYSSLTALEALGLVRSSPCGKYRVYSLSIDGYRSGIELLGTLRPNARDYVAQAAAWVRSLSFQQLVAAIYNKYPDMKVNSVFRR